MAKNKKTTVTTLADKKSGDANTFVYQDETYTKEQVLDDIQYIAAEREGKRVTRDWYRNHTEIPEAVWTHFFGSFPELLRQASLNPSRYQNKVLNQIARHADVDMLRKLDGERKQYAALYPRDNSNRWKTMVACSDLHDHEIDPFYRRVLTETVRIVQPDVVCLDGDIFDCPEFGKYTVDPREWDVVGRLQFGLGIIKDLREAAPNAQMDLIEGNHEARILKHLSESSPAILAVLADMHGMDVRKLFKLDELEVNYVASGDLFAFTDAQLRKETLKNYKVYWESLIAHHFPHGKNMTMPGFNGHHHKHMVYSFYNPQFGSYEWHQMGAGHVRQAPYCDGAKWNNGFLIVHVDTLYKHTMFDYVDVGPTMASAAGNFYYRREDEMYADLKRELAFRRAA